MKFITLLSITILLSGCANRKPIPIPIPAQEVNLKIGMIADTQITTENRTSGYLFRNMKTDSLVNVAIRTSAQEHLATEHLAIMLNSVADESPDIIVYLGDAANSGCDDEISSFMKVMETFRSTKNIPVFLTIGNHDYLATGNQAKVIARKQACGDQSYFTKEDLVKLFSEFNLESSKISTVDSEYHITSFIDVITDPSSAVTAKCQQVEKDEQHSKGCFYAGLVELRSKGKATVKLLLTDTSDYSDVNILPKLSEYFAFFGLRGSISWNSGQTDWFEKHLTDSDTLRVISSHYPVTDLGWTKFFMSRPGDLMTDDGFNLWLSAHTHTPVADKSGVALRYGTQKEGFKTVQHLNVGSTTDYKPHAAVVEIRPEVVRMRIIPSLDNREIETCKKKLYADSNDGAEILEETLGLTKAYRKKGYDTKKSRKSIDQYLAQQDPSLREYWIRCLINIAAKNEHG